MIRRHPIYFACWRAAGAYYRGESPSSDPIPAEAAVALRAIGAAGEPPDPATDFAALEDPQFAVPYLGGALQPLTMREIAKLLLRHLPHAELWYLGGVFQVATSGEYAVEGDADRRMQRQNAVAYLDRPPSPALDSSAVAPLYYLHVEASQRAAVADLEDVMRRWKKDRNIPERRLRREKFTRYFDAWDLREGWADGRYRPAAELKLEAVAGRLHSNTSTAFRSYREAFRLITGYEFSPARWFSLVGPVKAAVRGASGLWATPTPRRWIRAGVRRPVPNSVVSPRTADDRAEGVVARNAVCEDDVESTDTRLDAEEMFRAGRSDGEIADLLEISEDDVAYFRQRWDEFRGAGTPRRR